MKNINKSCKNKINIKLSNRLDSEIVNVEKSKLRKNYMRTALWSKFGYNGLSTIAK